MSPAVVALSTAGFWSTRTDEVTGSKPVRASAGGIFFFCNFSNLSFLHTREYYFTVLDSVLLRKLETRKPTQVGSALNISRTELRSSF